MLITSIDPLIIYRWKSDVFLRFCREPYHPFDPEIVEKYVVADNHLPFWEISSINNATENLKFSALEAFNYYLSEQDYDVEKIWQQIDDAIVSIILAKATQISRYVKVFQQTNKVKLFELLRFDFIIDETLNLHLMEINMSPNLTPTNERDERHSVMYEQLVYNTVTMLGMANYNEMKPKYVFLEFLLEYKSVSLFSQFYRRISHALIAKGHRCESRKLSQVH